LRWDVDGNSISLGFGEPYVCPACTFNLIFLFLSGASYSPFSVVSVILKARLDPCAVTSAIKDQIVSNVMTLLGELSPIPSALILLLIIVMYSHFWLFSKLRTYYSRDYCRDPCLAPMQPAPSGTLFSFSTSFVGVADGGSLTIRAEMRTPISRSLSPTQCLRRQSTLLPLLCPPMILPTLCKRAL
jgi:hypothetical protein